MAVDGMLIAGYVLITIGGVLIVVGFARLIWWRATYSRRRPRFSIETSPRFHGYYKDPWLRAPSMASIISRHENSNGMDNLKVDTDAIYAVPADHNSRGVILRSPDHEMSQTESQIYSSDGAPGSSGSGGHGGAGAGSRINVDGSGTITSAQSVPFSTVYSVLDSMSSTHGRQVARHIITENDESSQGQTDGGRSTSSRTNDQFTRSTDNQSLTEADRSDFSDPGYTDPPVDYSPERVVLNRVNNTSATVSATIGIRDSFSVQETNNERSSSTMHGYIMASSVTSYPTDTSQQSRDSADGAEGLRELSGSDLMEENSTTTAVFRDNQGDDVPARSMSRTVSRSTNSGSVKSMKSLYQYMYTEEPCALDREMEYSFTSSAL